MSPGVIDVARARRLTPGCEQVLHFNNAGASLMPAPVLEAVTGHLQREALLGGYEAAEEAAAERQGIYQSVARLLGCASDEVALVENATRAWDMAFYAMPLGPGDIILTSAAEYASNYIAFLQVCRRTGASIEVAPAEPEGQVSVEAVERALRDDPRIRLVALTHVPTNGGLVNPAAAIGRLTRAAGVPFLLDACQSVGQMPVDVSVLGCDVLSATGRKFLRGPRGTGLLYVRRPLLETLEPPLLDVHAATWVARDRYELRPDARRFENWESNVAGQLGLGVAIDLALEVGLEAIASRVQALAAHLRDRLADLPGCQVRDLGPVRCAIVSFTLEPWPALAIRDALRARRIHVSVSAVTSTRLDMEERGLPEVVRASVHYYNTDEEVERFVEELRRLQGRGG